MKVIKKKSLYQAIAATVAISITGPALSAAPTGPGFSEQAIEDSISQKLRNFNATNRIKGQYIVVFDENAVKKRADALKSLSIDKQANLETAIQEMAVQAATKAGGAVKTTYKHALQGFVLTNASEKMVRQLAKDPTIKFIEADQIMRANAIQSNPTWGLDRIDETSLPMDGQYVYNYTGSGVKAYIIDTGIRTSHNDFGGRAFSGYTAINDGNGTNDCNGHGTHVAGTVGSATYGVAKSVSLYAVRVLDCQGSGTNSGVIAGVDWVTQNHTKPAVANMSLGGGASSALDTAITNLVNAGVTVAVAAGNDNADACNYSPARAAAAITVGSTTNTDARSSFSNYGSCLDIFAPGSSITSTWSTGDTSTNTISGTSMASPHVAGVAALYLQANPSATPSAVTNAITGGATPNVVTDARTGSPNLLLNSLFSGNSGGGGGGGGGTQELQNGVAETGLSASTGNELNYTMTVPAGASDLSFAISGGTGDADIYVKFGSAPTTSSYDCRPYKSGNNETCNFTSPQTGTYYVMVRAYSSFSGVSLTGSYTEPGSGGGGGGGNTISDTNISASTGQWVDYTINVPAGTSRLTADIWGGSGDADLYVRFGNYPTTSSYNCRPYKVGNNENCTINNPSAGTWYISIRAYSSFSGVNMEAVAQ